MFKLSKIIIKIIIGYVQNPLVLRSVCTLFKKIINVHIPDSIKILNVHVYFPKYECLNEYLFRLNHIIYVHSGTKIITKMLKKIIKYWNNKYIFYNISEEINNDNIILYNGEYKELFRFSKYWPLFGADLASFNKFKNY